MKAFLLKSSILLGAVLLFLATPLWSAWTVREAIRNGDSHYLETAIDWPLVRATLTPSLHRIALGMPEQSEPAVQPGLWHRVKAYFGGAVVSSAIDFYVTPEGLPQLYGWRKSYRHYVSDVPDDSQQPIMDRMRAAWDRLKRAELVKPDAVRNRHYQQTQSRPDGACTTGTQAGWRVRDRHPPVACFSATHGSMAHDFRASKTGAANATGPSFWTRAVAVAGTRTQR